MAKRIIEENVVMTTFEVNEQARQETIRKHRTYVNGIKKSYNELAMSMSSMAAHFGSIVQSLERTVSRLERSNTQLGQKLQQSLEKVGKQYRNTTNTVRKANKETSDSFGGLLRAIGGVEQTLYRLSAGFFVASYGVSKLIDDQRELYYLSQKISMPVSDISRYSYVVSQIGGDSEKARQSLNRFSQTLQDMARGQNTEALEVYGRLGLSQFNSDGSIKNVTQSIIEVREKLENIESTQTKINYLRKLGFEENDFNYFLQDVSLLEERFEGIYRQITGISSAEFLTYHSERVTQLSNQMRTLNTVFNVTLQQLLNKLLPNLNSLINNLQVKLLANNENIIDSLDAFFGAMVELGNLFVSFVDMFLMFTGAIVDFWNNLGEAERRLLSLGGAFVGFFKLFSSSMMSTPFGRFFTLLSMGLMLIQDYVYWKKQMEGGNYESYYDWSTVDKGIEGLKKMFSGFENPFDEWNTSLLELLKNVDLLTVAMTALVAVMTGNKIPKALGSMLLKHPALAGISAVLGAAGYLTYDHMNTEEGKPSTLDKGAYFFSGITNKLNPFYDTMDKNTPEDNIKRDKLRYEDPLGFYERAVTNENFRKLEGVSYEDAHRNFERERTLMKSDKDSYYSTDAKVARMLRLAEQLGTTASNIGDSGYTELISNDRFNKAMENAYSIPQQNLGAENNVINNTNTPSVSVSKGDTIVHINGNATKETVDEITNVVNDDFIKQALSFESIIQNAQLLNKG